MTAAPPPPPAPAGGRALAPGRLAAAVALAAALWTLLARPPSAFAFAENAALRGLLLGLPAALWLGRRALAPLLAPPSRGHLAALAAVVGAGAALRLGVEALPWHAYNWVDEIAARVTVEPQPAWYANGFPILARVPYALGAAPDAAIFAVNRAAGALAPLALYALDRLLFGDARKALGSAALLALLPLHVRLSASESMQVLPSCLELVALAGFAAHARTGARALLAAGVMAETYAALSRPEAALAAAAVPLLYLGREERRRLRDPALWGLCAVAVAAGLPMLAHGAFGGGPRPLGRYFADPALALQTWRDSVRGLGGAMVLWADLGLAGFALLLLPRPRWPALVPPLLFAATAELAGFDTDAANRWQLLVPQWPWLALGASAVPAAAAALPRWLGAPRAAGAVAAAAAAAGFGVVAAAGAVRTPLYAYHRDQQDEWRFLRRVGLVEGLGRAEPFVRFTRGDDEDPAFPWFPRWRLAPAARTAAIGDLLAGDVPLPAVYYRAPHCFTEYHAGPLGPGGLRPPCADVERRFRLAPLATTRITSGSYTGTWAPGVTAIEVGFYRLTPR